ncbi:MAG: Re/Si-specific NAD(P)(+) transhydrogenase subunit alpha [Saprospiraceae bacterium]
MKVGILKEANEARVSIIPDTVKKLVGLGHSCLVETGAGLESFSSDKDYKAAGAVVTDRKEVINTVDLLISITPIAPNELKNALSHLTQIALFEPFNAPDRIKNYAQAQHNAFSLDMIPRITIAQSMDVLSSMASIAGYKAVLLAANLIPSYFPMLSTAAGSIPPAKVLILGAGVAGLQAIATAKRLGAVVEASDVRAAAKEEVMSLGGKFIEVEGATDDKGAGGYAVEQSEDFKKRQQALVQAKAKKADVIITTAQLRGRPAPTLIPASTVNEMRAGSVIIDLAASTGGNCELSKDNETVNHNGVRIVGNSNLAALVSSDASSLFSRNIFNFLKHLTDKEGQFKFDMEDKITASALIVKDGKVLGN